ncbi:MAG: carbon-nitrogen hydrolase family protein [Candidatus Dadabacteria bacterium]|nr:carbon-nitrogen hydrolase family protein [Candidatus Dadabacteria bacterium]NIQ15856.1 carbon-nitrogen hydrolase family protein [Candidatus Dadabacteria bacterium]
MSKIALIQKSSVLLDKEKTVEKAVSFVNEAADNGADLVVFTETFIPGYPAWIWRTRPGSDFRLCEDLYFLLMDNAVDLESDDLKPLYDAAKKNNITIVCGIEEKDSKLSKSTLYNTVIVINSDGSIINKHRKLMPTNPERMIWGTGDASGLKVLDTNAGRIGTLICWENYMPLARYTLYAQGVEIYIAPTYDCGDGWIGTLQHIAREGRCWVLGCGNILKGSNIPENFPEKEKLYPDEEEWINEGDSVVIEPGGKIVAGPLRKEEGILYYEVDPKLSEKSKRSLDVAGHYSRPDIFTLHVNTKQQSPIDLE